MGDPHPGAAREPEPPATVRRRPARPGRAWATGNCRASGRDRRPKHGTAVSDRGSLGTLGTGEPAGPGRRCSSGPAGSTERRPGRPPALLGRTRRAGPPAPPDDGRGDVPSISPTRCWVPPSDVGRSPGGPAMNGSRSYRTGTQRAAPYIRAAGPERRRGADPPGPRHADRARGRGCTPGRVGRGRLVVVGHGGRRARRGRLVRRAAAPALGAAELSGARAPAVPAGGDPAA